MTLTTVLVSGVVLGVAIGCVMGVIMSCRIFNKREADNGNLESLPFDGQLYKSTKDVRYLRRLTKR